MRKTNNEDLFESSDGWEQATAVIWQPEEGNDLWGIYDGNTLFTEGEFEQQALKHFVIEYASKIRHSFVGGQVFDKTLAATDLSVGDLIKIKYLGQKDTKRGQRVNLFDVQVKKV